MDTRRLLLGDWTPYVRDGIDVLRVLLAVGRGGAFLLGATRAGVILAVCAVAAWAARPLQLPRVVDLAYVVAWSMQGWGEAFRLYDLLPWFDEAMHFLIPMLSAPVVYIAHARANVVPDPKDETHTRHLVGIGILTVALGMTVGAVWEMVEWVSDRVLGSTLQEGNTDTVTDLMLDGAGAVLGALLLVQWTRHSWGSVRRIPGENRYEATS